MDYHFPNICRFSVFATDLITMYNGSLANDGTDIDVLDSLSLRLIRLGLF
ncbi:protein of unknown function [Candidatus Nitrosocosmicus franklandus]|uniref:Uncharacterized protein n=1 Tax=Candidatus Nitrosocosmicus franklandianus TaxID=1798806 RepID=A0A484IE13_9ARCH|nr:protein of unknown function [Candidatus Nitrosocosmicus franklandus]